MNIQGESLEEPTAFDGHKKILGATPMEGIITKNFFENNESEFKVNENEDKNTKSPFTNSSKMQDKDLKTNAFELKPYEKPSPTSTQVPIFKEKQNEVDDEEIDKQTEGEKKTKSNMFSIEFDDSSDEEESKKGHEKKEINEKERKLGSESENVGFNSLSQTDNLSSNIKESNLKNDETVEAEEPSEQNHPIEVHQEITQEVSASESSANPSIVMENCIPFLIKRDRQWLNKLWPQFNLYYEDTNEYFMSAKMTSNNASNTFIVAQGNKDFKENGPLYLGKIKTNVVGNIVNIFGPGYSPKDYNLKDVDIRYLLGTVEYELNVFGTTKPRNFKVYTLKPGYTYYENLVGPVKGAEEIPLNELYENPANKDMIMVYTNRKPYWNNAAKSFILNFGGRVKLSSVRNFILEDEENSRKVKAIFGKLDNDNFRLDIANPLPPIVGFGVALSAFGNKLFCE